jgi:hypothetical protein
MQHGLKLANKTAKMDVTTPELGGSVCKELTLREQILQVMIPWLSSEMRC